MKIGDRVKYVGSNRYYNPQRLGKFGVVRDRFDDTSVNIISESGDVWFGVYDENLEVVKNAENQSLISTVTRREIVPGQYGIVHVTSYGNVSIMKKIGNTPEQLREAAHILNQIAEVLEENGK